MSTFLSVLLGVLIVFPFLITFLLLVFYRKKREGPSESYWTRRRFYDTVLISCCLYNLAEQYFGTGSGSYIAVNRNYYYDYPMHVTERFKVKDFQIVRLLRKTWRLFFLVLGSSLYYFAYCRGNFEDC